MNVGTGPKINLFGHSWGPGRPEDDPDGEGRYARCRACDARENTPEAARACPGKWQLVQVHERPGHAEVCIRSRDGKTVYEGVLPLFPHPEQRR